MSNYDSDYYGWAVDQSARLLRLKPEGLDWEHLADEVSDLGQSQLNALESQLRRILIHLLKWKYQPGKRSLSWETSVEDGRDTVAERLGRSHSLTNKLDQSLIVAYRSARRRAAVQMGWDKHRREAELPKQCEWTIAQVLDDNFWPEANVEQTK